jgi:hypothetical protein
MKYTLEFSEQVRQLDQMVLLQKEYDLYEHKKRHIRKMMALHYKERSIQRMYEQEFREVTRQMMLLQRQMCPTQEFIDCPRLMISRYMELYQVSVQSVARTLHVSSIIIDQYLQKATQTPETRKFIYWAIRNFRLDANRYLKLIESLNYQEVI